MKHPNIEHKTYWEHNASKALFIRCLIDTDTFFLRQPNDTMFFDYLLEKIEFKRIESEAIKVMILKRTLKTVELVCLLAKIGFLMFFAIKKTQSEHSC